MPKIIVDFCHFYNGLTAKTQRAQSFFVKKLSLCALCVFAVSWFTSDNGA